MMTLKARSNEVFNVPSEYYLPKDVNKYYPMIKDKPKIDGKPDPVPYAQFLIKVLSFIRTEDGDLYIYNHAHAIYVKSESWLFNLIFKEIIEGIQHPWSVGFEAKVYSHILRMTKYAISEFNATNAINLKNGVFFLSDGHFEPHTPQNSLFTYCADYEYNPKASCKNFLSVVKHACCNDESLENVLQEIFGYCLSNENRIHKIFFFYGKGANSKSLLTDFLTLLVGADMVSAVSVEDLGDHFGLEGLINKKVNISNESTVLTNIAKMKAITGGDKVNVSRKYKTDYTNKLFCKLICVVNELPETNDVSDGYFRRIVIVPFMATIAAKDINPNLIDELVPELPGALLWAYEGYKRLNANNYNFSKSKVIEEFNDQYKTESNPTGEFFLHRYERIEGTKIVRSHVYDDYSKWCVDAGEKPMSRSLFYRAIESKAHEQGSKFKWETRRIKGYIYLLNYQRKS